MIRIGTVQEADFSKGLYKVRMGKLLTAWLPFAGARAGALKMWSPLTIGEQVILASPSGDLSQGVITGSIASDAHPLPGSDGSTINIEFPDGSKLSFGGGQLNFTTTAAVKIKAASIELEASAITIKGPITQTGDHVSDGISLKTHRHGGVQSGSSQTLPPT
jgi:phage baseplate assembly protein V